MLTPLNISLKQPDIKGISLLAHFPGITYKKYQEILRHNDSIESFFICPKQNIKKLKWQQKTKDYFLDWHSTFDLQKAQELLTQHTISIITLEDTNYPPLLKQMYDPPVALFIRGTLKSKNKTVAIVGSRKNTHYGNIVTQKIAYDLAYADIGIISGMARGIDSIAHKTSLEAGGYTIAVLGGGIDPNTITPRINYGLSKEILNKGGAILSEYPPQTAPSHYTYPMRNRIIAGLSHMVIVTEAAKKSGSLITAQYALDNNREIGAIPQNITNVSAQGTNQLIKSGGHMITEAQDIFDILDIKPIKKQPVTKLDKLEEQILTLLDEGCQTVDELLTLSNVPVPIVLSKLQLMELDDRIMIEGQIIYKK